MEEYLARAEIIEDANGTFIASIWSETEGEKELRAADLDTLFRELTMDLEFIAGEQAADAPERSAEEEFEDLQFAEDWGN